MKLESALDRIWQAERIRRDKLRDLLGIVLALSLDPLRGGLPAFSEAFRQKGMANHIKAWEAGNVQSDLNAEQVAWVFGTRLIDTIARRVDMDTHAVSRCLVELVPATVATIAQHRFPTIDSLPDELRFYLRGFEGFAQGVPGLESALRGELGIPSHRPNNTMQKLVARIRSLLAD